MSQIPSDPNHQDHPIMIARNARYGLILFAIYLLIYAAFVAISAFKPDIASRPILGGVNIAVVYGFSLIGLAFVMAIIYMFLCRSGGRS